MSEQFFSYFADADFFAAAEEMLRLYRPGAATVALTTEERSLWRQRAGEGDVLLEGHVQRHGCNSVCVAELHSFRQGCWHRLEDQRTVEALPWEDRAGAERRAMRLSVNKLLKDYNSHAQASPWGILRGVRPTKLAHRLLDAGQAPEGVRKILAEAYAVETDKTALLTEIALRQRPFLLSPAQARKFVSVYIGIPFCPSRCLYCSFPSAPIGGAGQQKDNFLAALRREIEAVRCFFIRQGLQVQTLYIGGGTPTSLPDEDFAKLLADVRLAFQGNALQEFTVEAGRPDTITRDNLAIMQEHGVTRISINPQTMREHTLLAIGRAHRPADVERAFRLAREAGFQNINMDIIAGLPGETAQDMAYTLTCIGELAPDNLTVHTLAVKRGSHLKEQSGYTLPEGRIVGEMLRLCSAAAQAWGLRPYYLYRQKYMAGNLENVGYALHGKECLYNIQIMEERQSIFGLGAAAATKAVDPGGWRLESCYNPKDVATYITDPDTYVERKLALVRRVLTSEEELLC